MRKAALPSMMLLAVFVVALQGRAEAQGAEAVYEPPFTSPAAQDADLTIFDPATVVATLRVPLSDLQAYIEALAPNRFTAVGRSDDPATAGLTFTHVWRRTTSIGRTSSRLAFFATADDRALHKRVTLLLALYANNAQDINDFFEAPVAQQASLRWPSPASSSALPVAVR